MTTESLDRIPTIERVKGFSGEFHPKFREKILYADELEDFGNSCRRHGKKIAYTTGTYDMIHIGHGRYLELAKWLANKANRDNGDMGKEGILVVGLNSDASVKSYKGPLRPILHESMRGEMLSFMGAVDNFTLYDEDTSERVIRSLRPDYYLCVEDEKAWEKWGGLEGKPEVMAMGEHNGITYCTPRQAPNLSTSDIIKVIETKAIEGTFRDIKQLLKGHGLDLDLDTELDQIKDASTRSMILSLKGFFNTEEEKINGNGNGIIPVNYTIA